MKNKEVFGLKGASQNVGLQKMRNGSIYNKNNVLPVIWVRSIAGQCARAQA